MNDLNSLVEEAVKSAPAAPPASSSSSGMNKSQRVRDYLKKNPEARNKDVADKLSDFGVTPADVGNAKSQMKKKAATKRASSASKPNKVSTPGPAKPASSATKEMTLDASIGLDVLDAGIEFINKAGGLNEAQYALNVIRRIKSL